MTSTDFFKNFFKGATLEIEDLFLLESFQIEYLPGWVPEKEFAAVLIEYPTIKRFILKKSPNINGFIEKILKQYGAVSGSEKLQEFEDTLVWSIADLLVYNKCPEVYDSLEFHNWDFSEITQITPLEGKVVVEGGSGTGRVTLRLAEYAKVVFAIEPVSCLRQFIREKVKVENMPNIFVMDGFLHSVPLPGNFADVFITSHALGWYIDRELPEFERVVKPGGTIIHCPGTAKRTGNTETHTTLLSSKWNYQVADYQEPDGTKRKYWKHVT